MTRQYTNVTIAVVSFKTCEMQRKFCKVFFIRLLFMIFFLFLPNTLLNFRIFWKWNFVAYQMIVDGLMMMHCPLQAFITLIDMPIVKKVANQVVGSFSWSKWSVCWKYRVLIEINAILIFGLFLIKKIIGCLKIILQFLCCAAKYMY